jgi:hypothetical protein
MKLVDKLWTPDEKVVSGKVTLELRDERTGKLQEKIEAENYATDLLTSYLKWAARRILASRCALTSPTSVTSNINPVAYDGIATNYVPSPSQNTDIGPSGVYNGVNQGIAMVLLTDASHAENAAGDRFVRGKQTAFADIFPYVGTDLLRGNENSVESVAAPTLVRFVFDWTTNAGNGTINSVYWTTGCYSGTSAAEIITIQNLFGFGVVSQGAVPYGGNGPVTQPWGTDWTETFATVTAAFDRGFILDPDGVSYWKLTNSNQLVKRTLGTGAVVSGPFTLAGVSSPSSLAWDGTKFWVADASNIKRFTTAGVNDLTYAASTRYTTYASHLCWAGGYLWFFDSGALLYKQMDPATGNIAASFAVTSTPNGGVTMTAYNAGQANVGSVYYLPSDGSNPDEFWFTIGGTNIYAYSTSGVFRRQINFTTPLMSVVSGLAMDSAAAGNVYYSTQNTAGSSYMTKLSTYRQFYARSLLPSSVTKSNTQTMKLTYEFDYS